MKKYFSISALALLSVLCFGAIFSSCEKDEEGSGSIVGTWRDPEIVDEDCEFQVSFYSDGTGFEGYVCGGEMTTDSHSFTWSVDGDTLIWDYEMSYKVKGNKLYITYTRKEDEEQEAGTWILERVK